MSGTASETAVAWEKSADPDGPAGDATAALARLLLALAREEIRGREDESIGRS
jgi:hypothetical protein